MREHIRMAMEEEPHRRLGSHGSIWSIDYRCRDCGARWSYTVDPRGTSSGFARLGI